MELEYNSETEEAIRKSLVKWRKVAFEYALEDGLDDCQLCIKFHLNKDEKCKLCPISNMVNYICCSGTPYTDFANSAYASRGGYTIKNPIGGEIHEYAKRAAIEELKFLKRVLKWYRRKA